MDRLELQRLRDLPIEGVAERLGLQVTRHKCLCPFHEDHHPSMSFSIRKNTYRCFVCGEHGGTIDLVMKQQRLGFKEACDFLNDGVSFKNENENQNEKLQPSNIRHQTSFKASRYERYFERPWLSPEARRFLFDERKLDPRVVRWCRLTSWKDRQGTPWLQIPYYDMDGKLIGVQNRNLGMKGEGKKEESLIEMKGEGKKEESLIEMKGERGLHPTPQTNLHPSSMNLHPTPQTNLHPSSMNLHPTPQTNLHPSSMNLHPTPQTNLHPSSINLHPSPPLWEEPPRFRFPAGSKCGIYNLPVLKMLKPGEELWITEGCSDCWAMLSSGHKAIAIPSATLLTQEDRKKLSTINCQLSTEFHMWPDCDTPGERLFLQLKEVLPDLVRHQLPQGCKDYSDFFLREKSLVKS